MSEESKVLGVSMRGWLAVLITLTVCIMSVQAKDIKEPLYSLSVLAIGFYFGQKTSKNGDNNEKPAQV